jgi:hypothetical protein
MDGFTAREPKKFMEYGQLFGLHHSQRAYVLFSQVGAPPSGSRTSRRSSRGNKRRATRCRSTTRMTPAPVRVDKLVPLMKPCF